MLQAEQQQQYLERQLEQEKRSLKQLRLRLTQQQLVLPVQQTTAEQPQIMVTPGAEMSRVGMKMPEFTPNDRVMV